MGGYLLLRVFIAACLASVALGQCAGVNGTCNPTQLCCSTLQCTADVAIGPNPVCTDCKNAVCQLASGFSVCCASGNTCIQNVTCCPDLSVCQTANGWECCGSGLTCGVAVPGTPPPGCVACLPTSRTCQVPSGNGLLVPTCCPEGWTCEDNKCKPPCPTSQICGALEAVNNKGCCPDGKVCANTWPTATSPSVETCCPVQQACYNPWIKTKPYCCAQNTECNGYGECRPCPTDTWCPATGTCCKDGTSCFGGTCCPKARQCPSPTTDGKEVCCKENEICQDGKCVSASPLCPLGTFYCWYTSPQYQCCPDSATCEPALAPKPCCDKPSTVCYDYPTWPGLPSKKVCCDEPSECLSVIYPFITHPFMGRNEACCPKDKICPWFNPATNEVVGKAFCCATTCATFSVPSATGSTTTVTACCPEDRFNPKIGTCCPIDTVFNNNTSNCDPENPPCPTFLQLCPLSNGTNVCCPDGTCVGGTIGCCPLSQKVCPVWPGWDPSKQECCNSTCLQVLYPLNSGNNTLGEDVCCPRDQVCFEVNEQGAPVQTQGPFCCSTTCIGINGVKGCCPKERSCGTDCCPKDVPCINGRCCPPNSQICINPATGEKVCCEKGLCLPNFYSPTTSTLCCGTAGSQSCLGPNKQHTCCPPGTVCMGDGTCCKESQRCIDPLTNKATCCPEGVSCVGGSCCAPPSSICPSWPSYQAKECCPKGNCLQMWSPLPPPGGPMIPLTDACCPANRTCRAYNSTSKVCCREECTKLWAGSSSNVLDNVCCPYPQSQPIKRVLGCCPPDTRPYAITPTNPQAIGCCPNANYCPPPTDTQFGTCCTGGLACNVTTGLCGSPTAPVPCTEPNVTCPVFQNPSQETCCNKTSCATLFAPSTTPPFYGTYLFNQLACCPDANVCVPYPQPGPPKEPSLICCNATCIPRVLDNGKTKDVCCPWPPQTVGVGGALITRCCPDDSRLIAPAGNVTCCNKTQICFASATDQNPICCPPGTHCGPNKQCSPTTTSDCPPPNVTCNYFPSLLPGDCCPKGNCLQLWVPPGVSVGKNNKACCPKSKVCAPHAPVPPGAPPRVCCNTTCVSLPQPSPLKPTLLRKECCPYGRTVYNKVVGCCPKGTRPLPFYNPSVKGSCCPNLRYCYNGATTSPTYKCCDKLSGCAQGKCCRRNRICPQLVGDVATGPSICCDTACAWFPPNSATSVQDKVCCSKSRLCLVGILSDGTKKVECCKTGQKCVKPAGSAVGQCSP